MRKIAAGKAFFMQSKHVNVNYLTLTRIRSSPRAFADLPRSVSDAAAFYMRRLVDACPWVEVVKRSACIEGARQALARAKAHWGRLDAERLITNAPPAGKEYRTPEMYYKTILKGARNIADECPRDVILE